MKERVVSEKIYAGVLGKIIGVYLGRPVESVIDYRSLIGKFGVIEYYVNEMLGVPLVVTDDDISGTFVFVNALSDRSDITSKDVANTWMNTLIEGKTILWWGGLGNSTEHTAYLRLKEGHMPPASGSSRLNSKGVSEQIGAQIFIDGWALAAADDTDLATALARSAAEVSHDGEAIHAAVGLAAMESLAFTHRDVTEIVIKAQEYLPENSEIARMTRDVLSLREREPSWLRAREYIERTYGYHLYPGSCHVVPNHALIIMSLLYGAGDFSQSLSIGVTSGWDTDCNGGNIGCLLGILNGIEAFTCKHDWRGPIADRCYISSAVPGMGLDDALSISYRLINFNRTFRNVEKTHPKNNSRYHFEMPGSVQGFYSDSNGRFCDVLLDNVTGNGGTGSRCLRITTRSNVEHGKARVGVDTFIPPNAKHMENYDFITSPSLYSGQTVKFGIVSDTHNPKGTQFRHYLKRYGIDDTIETEYSDVRTITPGNYLESEWNIDNKSPLPIFTVGIELYPQGLESTIYLDYFTWEGEPELVCISPKTIGEMNIRSWISNIDVYPSLWSSDDFHLVHNSKGLHFTGDIRWKNYAISAEVIPRFVQECGLVLHVSGIERYIALVLDDQRGLGLIQKYDDTVAAKYIDVQWDFEKVYRFALQFSEGRILGCIDDQEITESSLIHNGLSTGGCGFLCNRGTISINNVRITGLT